VRAVGTMSRKMMVMNDATLCTDGRTDISLLLLPGTLPESTRADVTSRFPVVDAAGRLV